MTDDDRLADVFEQYRDDETTDCTGGVFGKVGTGKTQQLRTELALRVAATDSTEFIDPKGSHDDPDEGGEPR